MPLVVPTSLQRNKWNWVRSQVKHVCHQHHAQDKTACQQPMWHCLCTSGQLVMLWQATRLM